MKYVRTKDGAFERMFPDCETQRISFDHKTIEPAYFTINYDWVAQKDVIKQADTVEELCDAYIYVKGNTKKIFNPGVFNKKDMDFFDAIYGAIFVVGDKGEPILKSVSQMNKEGVLKLL